MYASDLEKQILEQAAIRRLGSFRHLKRSTSQHRRSEAYLDEIMTMPASLMDSFQDLDPLSDDFGKRYFVAGMDTPGDPNHPPAP